MRAAPAGHDEREVAALALRLAMGVQQDASSVRDWRALLRVARDERLLPLAWIRAGAAIARVAPPEVVTEWRGEWLAALARAQVSLSQLSDLGAALERLGRHVVVLKGAPLAQRLYGDVSARPSVDVDCYAAPEARDAVRSAAIALGWRPASGEPPGDQVFARATAHGELFLEVHASLLGERLEFLPVPPPQGRVVDVAGVRLVAHDDALLPAYLATHLATHDFPPLLWWVDFATLWGSLGADGREAARAAAVRAGLHRYLAWACRRAAAVRRVAEGADGALSLLGFEPSGRRNVHQLWRHVSCAPDLRSARAAIGAWVRPAWAREGDGGLFVGTARRVGRHWRALLPSTRSSVPGLTARREVRVNERVSSLPPAELMRVARDITGAGGEFWLSVTGRSMTPLLAEGDRVLLAKVGRAVRPGQIVLREAAGSAMLHRVVAVDGATVLTRGDACADVDPPASRESVVAVAIAARRGGRLIALAPQPRFGVWALSRYAWYATRARLRALRAASAIGAPPAARAGQ